MKQFLLILMFSMCILSLGAQQPLKRIYIGNDDHTDYMWTANEADYDSAFVQMLDYYLDQIDSTQHLPDDFQARWNCDCSYWLYAYQKYRSPAQFERLINRIRSGHVSSPLNLLVNTYGSQSVEPVLRGMLYAGKLEREHKIRFPMAISMENQTLPLGLSSLWAGSGAKYSWKGVCACGTRMSKKGLSVRKNQLYNYKGIDDKSVLMKWYSHVLVDSNSRTLGAYAENRRTMKPTNIEEDLIAKVSELDHYCDTISPNSTYPYSVSSAFGYGSDDLATFTSEAFVAAAQKTTTPQRKVRVSNEIDFFEDIQQHYTNLPTQQVTFGNEWDLYCASMNETTAEVRRAIEKLRAAESLATLVSLKKPSYASSLTKSKESAWMALGMYWEHDWTADGPVSRTDRAEWQIRQKNNLTGYVNTLYDSSLKEMGGLIKSGAGKRMYAYNSLSWKRSDVTDFIYSGKGPVKVIDVSTGEEAASQLISKGGKQYLRVWAENIPAVGYKVFNIQAGAPKKLMNKVSFREGYLQNEFFKIRIHKSGVISQIYDLKAGGRQLVKKENGKYVNDLGTGNLESGNLSVINAGPVSMTIRAESNDPIPHVVLVTMYAKTARIDIEDSITANFKDIRTWSFSFGMDKPSTYFEETGAIILAKREINGGHYAMENARCDWQTFNHFATLAEKNYGITLSNQDCNFFQLGKSTIDSLDENSSQLNALAGGLIDGKDLGIHDQFGHTKFQYKFALGTQSAAFDQAASMRFALEHQNPLISAAVTGQTPVYPSDSYSFLTVNDPNVLLWALKPSEEGISNGVIARFWNLNEKAAKPMIRTKDGIKKLWQTSHIETNEKEIPFNGQTFNDGFNKQQINTYRLSF